MVFIVPGNFNKWTGQDIEKEGMGGSETFIIELTNKIQQLNKYDVFVFCETEKKNKRTIMYNIFHWISLQHFPNKMKLKLQLSVDIQSIYCIVIELLQNQCIYCVMM